MIEELLMNVVNAMSSCLDEEQLDKLQNVLYINFHDVRVVEEKNELQATGHRQRYRKDAFVCGV